MGIFFAFIITSLLFLILIALVFPGLLRALALLFVLCLLYTIGVANRERETQGQRLIDAEQDGAPPSPETTIPIPHTAASLPRWQEVRTPSGAYLCRNGHAWSVGLCPPHRPDRY